MSASRPRIAKNTARCVRSPPSPRCPRGMTRAALQDVFEVQRGAIPAGARVLIVDDLLATGGTMKAAVSLVKAAGGEVLGCMTLIEIAELEGYKNVEAPTYTLLRY